MLIKHLTSTVPVASYKLHKNTTYPNQSFIAKLDLGATKHFLTNLDGQKIPSHHNFINGPSASLPNNTIVKATKMGLLPL